MLGEEQPSSSTSDAGSVSSHASAVFSAASSLSSKSSIASIFNDTIDYFVSTITEDDEVRDLYQTALSKYTAEQFIQNHNRLLKRYYLDVATEFRTGTQGNLPIDRLWKIMDFIKKKKSFQRFKGNPPIYHSRSISEREYQLAGEVSC